MVQKHAVEKEFVWSEDDVLVHLPTGARFAASQSSHKLIAVTSGVLGIPLNDGQDYDVESVLDLAWKLAEMRAR